MNYCLLEFSCFRSPEEYFVDQITKCWDTVYNREAVQFAWPCETACLTLIIGKINLLF